jgi:hypothetical protein
MNKLRTILGIAFPTLLATAPAAWAHPGHGPLDHGARHWANSPDHLVWSALLGLGLLFAARIVSSPRARTACALLGACLMAAALFSANGRG